MRDLPRAFQVAEQLRVYVTKDGQPIGGLISMEMMVLLEQAIAEREARRAGRASVSVRVVPRATDPEGDCVGLAPSDRIAVMTTLSRSARAIAAGTASAGA
ncbi:MAG: hypothetical protein K2X99_07375 [Gemmatimonadaceae bacterium]|nr:hypothetical protein [Gemmatimonadaceae bacterium]